MLTRSIPSRQTFYLGSQPVTSSVVTSLIQTVKTGISAGLIPDPVSTALLQSRFKAMTSLAASMFLSGSLRKTVETAVDVGYRDVLLSDQYPSLMSSYVSSTSDESTVAAANVCNDLAKTLLAEAASYGTELSARYMGYVKQILSVGKGFVAKGLNVASCADAPPLWMFTPHTHAPSHLPVLPPSTHNHSARQGRGHAPRSRVRDGRRRSPFRP